MAGSRTPVALTALNHIEIQQLYSRYCFAIDHEDIERFAVSPGYAAGVASTLNTGTGR
jgi:hypothetical protein